ncbi:MAG: HTH domain-containing protein [Rhodocyclaceae bacterium]|nr:HTH domain-containing protein [Rhodocyclaceae bacterium]
MTAKKKITLDDFKIFDARAKVALEVARAVDEGKPIPHSVVVKSHSLETLLSTLTPKRYELLRLSRKGKYSISELAQASNRDSSTVSKDISKLVALGLVEVILTSNAGHGIKKIVRPAAKNIEIQVVL